MKLVEFFVRRLVAAMFIVLFLTVAQQAQTNEFTYQGQLQNASAPANGNFDFEFLLYDALTSGAQVGSTISQNNFAVANGLFSFKLNFGANFPGANRFLEIRVRQTGGGAFTTLTPRQAITSAPYSVKSLSAVNADTATTATTAANLSGTLNGDVTGTQTNTTVGKLRGIPLDTTAPTDGQMLRYDAANNKWTPVAMPTGGTTPANYVFSTFNSNHVGGRPTWTGILFANHLFLNGWTADSSTGSFTCGQTGLYLVQYTAVVEGLGLMEVRVLLNEVEIAGSRGSFQASGSINVAIPIARSFIAVINSGDQIRLQHYSPSSGGLTVGGDGRSAWLTITRMQ